MRDRLVLRASAGSLPLPGVLSGCPLLLRTARALAVPFGWSCRASRVGELFLLADGRAEAVRVIGVDRDGPPLGRVS
jgi:hypothetical protein